MSHPHPELMSQPDRHLIEMATHELIRILGYDPTNMYSDRLVIELLKKYMTLEDELGKARAALRTAS